MSVVNPSTRNFIVEIYVMLADIVVVGVPDIAKLEELKSIIIFPVYGTITVVTKFIT